MCGEKLSCNDSAVPLFIENFNEVLDSLNITIDYAESNLAIENILCLRKIREKVICNSIKIITSKKFYYCLKRFFHSKFFFKYLLFSIIIKTNLINVNI